MRKRTGILIGLLLVCLLTGCSETYILKGENGLRVELMQGTVEQKELIWKPQEISEETGALLKEMLVRSEEDRFWQRPSEIRFWSSEMAKTPADLDEAAARSQAEQLLQTAGLTPTGDYRVDVEAIKNDAGAVTEWTIFYTPKWDGLLHVGGEIIIRTGASGITEFWYRWCDIEETGKTWPTAELLTPEAAVRRLEEAVGWRFEPETGVIKEPVFTLQQAYYLREQEFVPCWMFEQEGHCYWFDARTGEFYGNN